jgi:RND family efflux transporter MFP subunit
MKNKLLPIFFSVFLLSILSCGEKTENKKPEQISVDVKIEYPTTSLPQLLSYKGKIQSSKSIDIQSRGSSYVDKILVDVGDAVHENQLLVKLNSDDLMSKQNQLTAKLDEVSATLENTEKDYKRYKSLREKNSVSEKELESISLKYNSVKSQKAGVESQLKEIQSELKYFNIKAPFEGVITSKMVQEGDLANPRFSILQMEVENAFEFHFSVSERAISSLRKGQLATVVVSTDGQKIDAQISELSLSSSETGGQYVVKAKLLTENDVQLFSGQQGEIQLITDSLDQGIFVPKSALIDRGGLQGLYVVSPENKAMLRWVETGVNYDEYIEILSGLSSDESVVTSADSKLYNGITVKY